MHAIARLFTLTMQPTTSLASPEGFVSQLLNGVDRWQVIQFSRFVQPSITWIGEVPTEKPESLTH